MRSEVAKLDGQRGLRIRFQLRIVPGFLGLHVRFHDFSVRDGALTYPLAKPGYFGGPIAIDYELAPKGKRTALDGTRRVDAASIRVRIEKRTGLAVETNLCPAQTVDKCVAFAKGVFIEAQKLRQRLHLDVIQVHVGVGSAPLTTIAAFSAFESKSAGLGHGYLPVEAVRAPTRAETDSAIPSTLRWYIGNSF
jgi:hypothetical protein